MVKHTVSLDDKYALDETRQLLTGTQAIVRLMLTQRARDLKAGLNTAGYVTGYRGSPIASLEAAMLRARKIPSRVAVGLVYSEQHQAFAGHMWTEAYVDGVWTPLDATLGKGGTGPAHIKVAVM